MSERNFSSSVQEAAQSGLLALMTGISQELYCATWMNGLDVDLQRIAYSDERSYGMGTVTDRQALLLRLLSEEAGGWWVWREGEGEVFLTPPEHLAHIEATEAAKGNRWRSES